MTIEVRQLSIKSQVSTATPAAERAASPVRELEQAKLQILAECKAWLQEKLQDLRER